MEWNTCRNEEGLPVYSDSQCLFNWKFFCPHILPGGGCL